MSIPGFGRPDYRSVSEAGRGGEHAESIADMIFPVTGNVLCISRVVVEAKRWSWRLQMKQPHLRHRPPLARAQPPCIERGAHVGPKPPS